jgi:hypothetical protein
MNSRTQVVIGQLRDRMGDGDGAITTRVFQFLWRPSVLDAYLDEMEARFKRALESVVNKVTKTSRGTM